MKWNEGRKVIKKCEKGSNTNGRTLKVYDSVTAQLSLTTTNFCHQNKIIRASRANTEKKKKTEVKHVEKKKPGPCPLSSQHIPSSS